MCDAFSEEFHHNGYSCIYGMTKFLTPFLKVFRQKRSVKDIVNQVFYDGMKWLKRVLKSKQVNICFQAIVQKSNTKFQVVREES